MAAARGVSGRGPKARGRRGEGAPPRGIRGGRRKQKVSSKRQQQQLRQTQGGSLPRRPDIKGLDGEGNKKKQFKHVKPNKHNNNNNNNNNDKSSSSSNSSSGSRMRSQKEELQHKKQKQHGGGSKRREGGGEKTASDGSQRKRKLSHGQERLRALLTKHPELLHAGESADAAVAACFKKAAGGPLQQPEATSEAPSSSDNHDSQQQLQQQQVSGSKRRKLLRLVMSSRTAEEKVFVHKAYQLYNEILRNIRAAEGGGDRSSRPPNSRLQNLVGKAVSFLEEPLAQKDRHSCTARLAQVCLKHAEGDLRLRLWELLFKSSVAAAVEGSNSSSSTKAAIAAAAPAARVNASSTITSAACSCSLCVSEDFTEFCCCKSFHHVAMKLHLYGSEQQRERLIEKLVSRKEAAFTRHGATVWEYIYCAQKTAVAQQKLLNCLLLEPAVLVAVPQANQCTSFSQVMKLLSETQQKKALEDAGSLIQKCVDKELLGKAHVHRIVKALCRQEAAAALAAAAAVVAAVAAVSVHDAEEVACGWGTRRLQVIASIYLLVAEPQQLSAIWSTVAEGALHMATTKDGVEGIARLLGYASAKERKSVVKSLKQHCLAFALNPVDCPLILRLLLTELLPAVMQLAFDAYGHLLLLQLLQTEGICKQLPTHYQELLALPSPTRCCCRADPCAEDLGFLKAAATRQAELRPAVVKALTSAIVALPLDGTEGDESQHSVSALLKDSFASKVFVQLAHYPEAEAALMRGIASVEYDLQQKKPSLLSHPYFHPPIVAVVAAVAVALKAGCREAPSILAAAWGALAKRLASVLETKGVFVILQIFNSARELQQSDLEAQMRKQLNDKLLGQAEAAAQNAGKSPSNRHSASAQGSGDKRLNPLFP
ncbi:hypothetical protein Emed_003840 [Eimeria media]